MTRNQFISVIVAVAVTSAVGLAVLISGLALDMGADIVSSAFGLTVVPWLLLIASKLFKLRVPALLHWVFIIYIILAMGLGATARLYDIISFWDTLCHFIFGFIMCYFTLWLLFALNSYRTMRVAVRQIFFFLSVMAMGAVWEIMEFTMDTLFDMNTQHVETGVTDTMVDIIANMLGGLVFNVCYAINTRYKNLFLIAPFIRQYSEAYPSDTDKQPT